MNRLRQLTKYLFKAIIPKKLVTYRINNLSKSLAITFDDGPNQKFTPQILDILKCYNIKATFFVVGSKVKQYPDLTNRIINEGHELGNHSYTHNHNINGPINDFTKEIYKTNQLLKNKFSYNCRLFRPPYGAISFSLLTYCITHKLTICLWSLDPKDFLAHDASSIVENIFSQKNHCGEILLLHDNNINTEKALPIILNSYAAQQFSFTHISTH